MTLMATVTAVVFVTRVLGVRLMLRVVDLSHARHYIPLGGI